MALTAVKVTRQFLRKRGASNVFNAVEDVSLTLGNGKITVITGPSGSGKSTLLNMMAGILTPTSGKITVDGTDLYSLDDEKLSIFRNEHIGVIPQGQTALHSLNVMDNVLLPYTLWQSYHKTEQKVGAQSTAQKAVQKDGVQSTAQSAPRQEADIRKRAEALLQQTGIADLANVMPSELSGGELRRMAIVRAMILQPDVILADEPTADLDEENTRTVLTQMQYAAKEGSAVLIVTHDKDVFDWADSIYTMRSGRLEKDDK